MSDEDMNEIRYELDILYVVYPVQFDGFPCKAGKVHAGAPAQYHVIRSVH